MEPTPKPAQPTARVQQWRRTESPRVEQVDPAIAKQIEAQLRTNGSQVLQSSTRLPLYVDSHRQQRLVCNSDARSELRALGVLLEDPGRPAPACNATKVRERIVVLCRQRAATDGLDLTLMVESNRLDVSDIVMESPPGSRFNVKRWYPANNVTCWPGP